MARGLFSVALLAVALAAPSLSARDYHVAQGRLLVIDPGASTLVIRTGEGALQCAFDGNTRVTGAADRIDELTALSQLTVHYSTEQMHPLATMIEVHPGPF